MTELTFPKDSLRLLYRLYFKPFTLRWYVQALDPRLDEDLALWEARDRLDDRPALRELAQLSWVLGAVAPFGLTIVLGLLIKLVAPFHWGFALSFVSGYTGSWLIGHGLRWRGQQKFGWGLLLLLFGGVSAVVIMSAENYIPGPLQWFLNTLGSLAALIRVPVDPAPLLLGLMFGLMVSLTAGLAFGIAFGLALGLVFGLADDLMLFLAWGLAIGLMVGLLIGSPSAASNELEWVVPALALTFGLSFGLGFGAEIGPAIGPTQIMAILLAGGLAIGLPLSLTCLEEQREVIACLSSVPGLFGLIYGLMYIPKFGVVIGLLSGLGLGLAFLVSLSRLFLYPLELAYTWVLARLAQDRPHRARHYLHCSPIYWDEVIWRPLLGLDRLLVIIGQHDRRAGAEEIAYVGRFPFQRWAVRNALTELPALAIENARDLEILAHLAEGLEQPSAGPPWWSSEVLLRTHGVVERMRQEAPENETLYDQVRRLQRVWREPSREAFPAWAEGALAGQEMRVGPVPNIYVPGTPLMKGSPLFKGRDDLFQTLERILARSAAQRQPLLLYGQRRNGKTSVLNQLPLRLGPDYISVLVDMQNAANAESAAGLLDSLASAIRKNAHTLRRLQLPHMSPEKLATDPYAAFQEWVVKVENTLGSHLVLLNLDEYEWLEKMLADERIDRRILNLLRDLIQHHPKVVVLLSGSHMPQEMPGYWSEYLVNPRMLHVSYLEEDEARELIEEPVPGFPVRYEEEAVTRVVAATRGQPFLIHATCNRLVDLANRERRWHLTLADVEEALEALIAAEDTPYWHEVWAGHDTDDAQRRVLLALARDGDGIMTEEALVRQVGSEVVEKAIPRLIQREILEKVDGNYRYQVELVCRWVQRHGRLEVAVS